MQSGEMKLYQIAVPGVLVGRGGVGHRDAGGTTSHGERGRGGSDESVSRGPARTAGGHPKRREEHGAVSLLGPPAGTHPDDFLILDFWTPELGKNKPRRFQPPAL